MKKPLLLALLSILAFSFSIQAQTSDYYSSRLENLTSELKRQTVDLVDRTSDDLRRNYSNTRADVEAAFLAHQMDASARLFQDMLRDKRPASELRDGAGILSDLARRAPNGGANGYLWRNAQNAVSDINRELGGSNNGGGTGGNLPPIIGRASWRGTVDHEVHLAVENKSIETRVISGTPYPVGEFSFTTPLPRKNISVEVIVKKGRGTVRVLQQPSRENGATAVIQILDKGSGAKEYQLEIVWRQEK